MKKLFVLIFVFITVFNLCIMADASEMKVSAKSAVLICADTGQVLYAKNADEQLSMESTTKIMTALLALENLSIDSMISVGSEVKSVEGTSLGLRSGDIISVYDLICGLMLASGNDAANAIAVAVSGTVDTFVELMNSRAELLGLDSTHFATPSGLDADDHYSTAYDMAILTSIALKNDIFSEIVSTYSAKINISNRNVWLTNHNRLLKSYDGMIGVKTGFTKKSGRCLVTAAERNGCRLISVTLHAPDDWNDHKEMLDYGFSVVKQFAVDSPKKAYYVDVVGANTDKLSCSAYGQLKYAAETELSNISYTVCIPAFLYAPIEKGQVVSSLLCYSDKRLIGKIVLCADEEVSCVAVQDKANIIDKILQFLNGWFSNG